MIGTASLFSGYKVDTVKIQVNGNKYLVQYNLFLPKGLPTLHKRHLLLQKHLIFQRR